MRMSKKCRNNNNNFDNPLTSRRTDGGNSTTVSLGIGTRHKKFKESVFFQLRDFIKE